MLARYRTQAGAARYAKEIAARFPHCDAKAVPNGFDFCVMVTLPDGATALAAKRPRGYSTRPTRLIDYALRVGEKG